MLQEFKNELPDLKKMKEALEEKPETPLYAAAAFRVSRDAKPGCISGKEKQVSSGFLGQYPGVTWISLIGFGNAAAGTDAHGGIPGGIIGAERVGSQSYLSPQVRKDKFCSERPFPEIKYGDAIGKPHLLNRMADFLA
jgi:hypothetical protein